MKAGRALDWLVTEKVLGWKPWVSGVQPRGSTKPDCWATKSRRSPSYRIADWQPSRDIAAAWAIVEKMRKTHCVQVDTVGFEGEEFRCLIGWGDDPSTGVGEAATAPHAICLAALEAIGYRSTEPWPQP